RDQLIQLSRQLEEATHAKLVFFTNISHDFRTPLTLVADPIDQLLQDRSLNKEQNMMLTMIKKNVNILLRLVNQVLDFRKYENGKMEYNPTLFNLEKNIREWNLSFHEAARKKAIHFKFDVAPAAHYCMDGDLEKIERIYFNLLSNAFKFTPENGRILVSLSVSEQQELQLTVSNTGNEISVEHIQCIFDRFYTIDMHHSGSGIGLALTKAFVELHGGTISVESNPQTGTSFIVRFIQAKSTECIQQNIKTTIEIADLNMPLSEEGVNSDEQDLKKTTLLIIDDNLDIRNYIRSIFEKEYAIIEATNGSDGIQKAMRYVPNLIISDIMMPGIDGIECCKRLKNQIQTCHIPVILLTACTLDEQRISGYNGGADSYISKPFSTSLLRARVKNLIESHSRLKQVFADQSELSKEDVSDMDYDFINRFKSVIASRMSDSELNIDILVQEMGMSRVQLYRKVKSLTNYSPNEFIRLTRLKKASLLLTSSDMTVAEIGYHVGFSSPSYFTKCYKEHFGESPSEFLKNKNRKTQDLPSVEMLQ
ncbi:MAG: response regulator, partial [Bacteroidales bacterium]